MLITCIECQKQVSDSVKGCPHCAGNPKGVECCLCGKQVAKSKAKSSLVSDGRGKTDFTHYHTTCLEDFKARYLNLKNFRWNCPECHNDLSQEIIPDSFLPSPLRSNSELKVPTACASCGYERHGAFGVVGHCTKCKLPICPSLHAFLEGHIPADPVKATRPIIFRYHIPLCLEYMTNRGFKTDQHECRYRYYGSNGELEREIAPINHPGWAIGCMVILGLFPLIAFAISICLYVAA